LHQINDDKPQRCNEKINKIYRGHPGALVIELNGGTHVQQYQYQYQTIADINNSVYDEVKSQKLKLFSRGNSHVGCAISIWNKPVTRSHQLIQHY